MPAKVSVPATQVEIARRCNLDVSSVNKILNRVDGPVFRKETVQKVFRIAREVGYDFNRATKGALAAALRDLRDASKRVLEAAEAGEVAETFVVDELKAPVERVGKIIGN